MIATADPISRLLIRIIHQVLDTLNLDKEYRTVETCGLKLVWFTRHDEVDCGLCSITSKKRRRVAKMASDGELESLAD